MVFTVRIALERRTKKGTKVDDNNVLCKIIVSLPSIPMSISKLTNLYTWHDEGCECGQLFILAL